MEEQLVEACKRKESWAQKQIYEKYAQIMMGVCMRYVHNKDVAQDLMHDGFVKVFVKIKCYSGTGSFEGWMRKVFVNTALEFLRKNDALRFSMEFDSAIQTPSNDISVFEKLAAEDLLSCIAELPSGFRTIFNLHVIEGYSHVEIAKILNINEGTSRSQYSRARQALQKIMRNKYND